MMKRISNTSKPKDHKTKEIEMQKLEKDKNKSQKIIKQKRPFQMKQPFNFIIPLITQQQYLQLPLL
jgi:hypothetical protein